ncbi:CvpA family protein [Lutibaculum baratangense]|uniref:Colicin V production protein n=1 Tax=Lutibaculum baratangense AMV1 TaxID=631454 RepID=V4RBT3_9HYPH|nr:CvpA family protein [Lutibaculum baratangense]ESR23616.1 Colicin V production protein [Lutibaculum baratangense AMV1]
MVITGLDFIVVIVMLISGLLAMVRGLTREVLSIASWVAAALVTLYTFPRFQGMVREQLQPDWLADISLALGVFVLTLIIVSFITMRISDFILDSRIGAVDRSLGFVFGLARGLLIVVIGYLFFAWLVPEENQPRWVVEARSKDLLQDTGAAIIALLPEDPEEAILDRLRNRGRGDDVPPSGAPQPGEDPEALEQPTEQGYAPNERGDLDQLLDSTAGAR